jgi:hypothetical protein
MNSGFCSQIITVEGVRLHSRIGDDHDDQPVILRVSVGRRCLARGCAPAHAGMSTTISDMHGDSDTPAGYDGRALAEERRVLGRCAEDLAADGAQGRRRGCHAGRREEPGRAKVGEMAQMVATDVKATMQPDRCAFPPEEAPDAVIKQTLAMAARIHSARTQQGDTK